MIYATFAACYAIRCHLCRALLRCLRRQRAAALSPASEDATPAYATRATTRYDDDAIITLRVDAAVMLMLPLR